MFGILTSVGLKHLIFLLTGPRQNMLQGGHFPRLCLGWEESRMRGDFVPSALQSLMEKQDLGDLKRVVDLGSFMHFRL